MHFVGRCNYDTVLYWMTERPTRPPDGHYPFCTIPFCTINCGPSDQPFIEALHARPPA